MKSSYPSTIFLSLALVHPSLSTRTTHQTTEEHPSNGICADYKIRNTIDFAELQWAIPPFNNNYDVIDLYNRMSSKDSTVFVPFADEKKNVTETYEISATFCRPKNGKNENGNTLLVATHGAGCDKRYWASTYRPEKYSFAFHALEAGYPIFYYDRAGVGASSPTPNYRALAEPQIELLARMLRSIRNGEYTADVHAKKVVLVGHSFGSTLSSAMLARYPTLAEGAVLSGIAFPKADDVANILGKYALTVFGGRLISSLPASSLPSNAASFDDSFLYFADKYNHAQVFMHHPQTAEEKEVADYAFSISQPFPVSEFGALYYVDTKAPKFEGKVLITAGQYDFVCGGDCYSTYRDGVQRNVTFPKAEVRTFVQPGAGHGSIFHEDNGALSEIFGFLKSV